MGISRTSEVLIFQLVKLFHCDFVYLSFLCRHFYRHLMNPAYFLSDNLLKGSCDYSLTEQLVKNIRVINILRHFLNSENRSLARQVRRFKKIVAPFICRYRHTEILILLVREIRFPVLIIIGIGFPAPRNHICRIVIHKLKLRGKFDYIVSCAGACCQ